MAQVTQQRQDMTVKISVSSQLHSDRVIYLFSCTHAQRAEMSKHNESTYRNNVHWSYSIFV